ncbi:hypothetical protein CRUP_024694 [Coryphaenoides rupestris]|nr:hypothetical protein CRUP_024694 [Coryphaenoides rupestris]
MKHNIWTDITKRVNATGSGQLRTLEQQYNYHLQFTPGRDNVVADLLSRAIPNPPIGPTLAPGRDSAEHDLVQLLHTPLQGTVSLKELQDASADDPVLSTLSTYIRQGWPAKIPISALVSFVEALEVGYSKHKNPYHNLMHAADVTQTVHYLLLKTGIMHWLTELEILAMIFAAAVHDYEHTGTTNNFHIQTR